MQRQTISELALILTTLWMGGQASGVDLHVWQRWEHALKSSYSYTNPYAEVTLRATHTGPGPRTIHAYGFWDGGETFRIRCAISTPGTWHWQTECSDPSNTGLHGPQGTIKEKPYTSKTALYRHGFLKVSDNRRYLTLVGAVPCRPRRQAFHSSSGRSGPTEGRKQGTQRFTAPRTGDWVLLMERKRE